MKIAISTSELTGFRQQIRHRLRHRAYLLSAHEHSFLLSMEQQMKVVTAFSEKQLEWLIALLDRTLPAGEAAGGGQDGGGAGSRGRRRAPVSAIPGTP